METLALFLGDDGVPEDYRQLASAFEHDGSFAKAADAHRRAGRLEHAVRCYLKAGDDDAVGAAVAVAGEARGHDALTAQVVDFLSSASRRPTPATRRGCSSCTSRSGTMTPPRRPPA